MRQQVDKYLAKLIRHGLVSDEADAALYGLDDEISTNRARVEPEVSAIFSLLNINSLIVARPERTLHRVVERLVEDASGPIRPRDCESLTFFHDIPVVPSLEPGIVAAALKGRKGCIVRGTGLVTIGTVSLEQAFITLSSICFACFVKFFTDAISGLAGRDSASPLTPRWKAECLEILELTRPRPAVLAGPSARPDTETGIVRAMDAAGRAVVEAGLVDSFFGNISWRAGQEIFISQTGSSLDELPGYIDRVPLDGSSTCGITSSSELMAHIATYELTGDEAIVHGHPRYSVIMSMAEGPLEFGRTRFIGDVPVVAGEVGAGSRGLVHTLPQAMQERHCAVVSGHGTFTSSNGSFEPALERLSAIELMCHQRCRDLIAGTG